MRRFPHNAPQDVQDAFMEISDDLRKANERLRILERAAKEGGASRQDLDAVKADVARAARSRPPEWDDVFRASGASHSIGHVPDPGSAAGTTKFLREDATFAAPSPSEILLANGSAGTPSLRFTNDLDTGLYLRATNQIGLSAGGALRAIILSAGIYPGAGDTYRLGGLNWAWTDIHYSGELVGHKENHGGSLYDANGLDTAVNFSVWRALYPCTVTNVRGWRVGGTGATVNARKNGSSNHLSSALSLTSASTWMDGGSVQNTAYAAGDELQVMFVTFAGDPTYIDIQVDFKRAD